MTGCNEYLVKQRLDVIPGSFSEFISLFYLLVRNYPSFPGIFQTLFNRLPDVYFVQQVIPIGIFRKTLEKMLNFFLKFGSFHSK